MQDISLTKLLEAGCHFGHKADRWHPKAAKFIYQKRDGIHVIDLAKTKAALETSAQLIRDLVSQGKQVLFVGTKRQAAIIVKTETIRVGAPYISQRWVGGFLTNWPEVHKNLEKIRRLTQEQEKGDWNKFPKHERVKLARYLNKLNYLYSGVVQLTQVPDMLVVVDIRKENVAVAEATKMEIPVVGIVDTNADPDTVTYAIPSNDDAVGAIDLIVKYLTDAYLEGSETRQKELATKAKAEEKALQQARDKAEQEKKTKEAKQSESMPAKPTGAVTAKTETAPVAKVAKTVKVEAKKPEVVPATSAEAEKPKRGRKKKETSVSS